MDKQLSVTDTQAVKRDLDPHPEAATEWWFSQGHFHGEKTGRRDFMFMLGRRFGRSKGSKSGWILIISILDPVTNTKKVTSLACESKEDAFVAETINDLVDAGMPPELAEAYVDEIVTYGPAAPARLSTAMIDADDFSLNHSWENFKIEQREDSSVAVEFVMPEASQLCRLHLTPQAPWFFDERIGREKLASTMEYASCPRLELTGSIDNEIITGDAWFDHQWGGHGWFEADKDNKRVLGWDWLAINFDNGTDLLVYIFRDMRTRKPVMTGGVIFRPDENPHVIKDFEGTELEWWQSEDSYAKYPVCWRFKIPEINADLVFRTRQKNCEIPLFGILGTVWEGPGTVTGTINGEKARGRGHLELFGYAFPTDFERNQKEWIERIDKKIEGFLPRRIDNDWLCRALGSPRWRYDSDALTRMISDPAWELISRGGKHWRSVFSILMLRALGKETRPYEELITVIPELLHAGSLMIDDIEDKSVLRRGKPAIHELFGEALTINAGNSLYFLPLLLVARHPLLNLQQREAIYRISYDLFIRAHAGQAQDLYSERWCENPQLLAGLNQYAETVLQTYTLKTAAPLAAVADVLCVIAGVDKKTNRSCLYYAETAGIAYQIIDDVNNFIGDASWGKEIGEDIREKKLTYVILRALEALPENEQQQLWQILQKEKGSISEQEQAEGCKLVTQSGVLERCREEAVSMIDEAWRELSSVLEPSTSKTMLRLLMTRLFIRKETAEPKS